MSEPLNFQSIIMTLQRYWADQGCLIWQPYYTQVGAGTNNPATILRVLGPEPWKVAYVEPSVRPDDGRYGENPNRLQMHYQFQVILKPDPGNPQELYLHSLEALGIDPRQHDIRFVEDNWESPALGAWGLGWEVWLDGQEITQFTYFQQAGGLVLNPVAVEITYGLERIAMALQKVSNFQDIQWSPTRTDGDVNLQAEQEHSRYYFEIADVDRLRQMFDLFETEANVTLENRMVLPALDYILKCSHTFNVLDTRGAVGVTERQALFGRMRDLTRKVAEAYLAQRQELGFPWLPAGAAETGPAASAPVSAVTPDAPATFLLEIGTEELPAADLDSSLAQLKDRVPAWLDELRLAHGDIHVAGTPRRLVFWVEQLAPRQEDSTVVVKGPPAERAFDADGKVTKAGEGFAKSRGVNPEALQIQEVDGGKYVVAMLHETGRSASEILSEALPGLVAGIKFDKSMRWNDSGISFSRPLRWFLSMFGSQVVPFQYAGYTAGRVTRGLRFRDPETFTINQVDEYFTCMDTQGVILDPAVRSEKIAADVKRLVNEVGGVLQDEPSLLAEVTQLVEAPIGLRGGFDPAYLSLPEDVLISVMKKHQRYFPVHGKDGLLPYFIAIRNGDSQGLDVVTDGNEQVIRARFADAAFFVREDKRQTLESYVDHLSTLTFQIKLGSMLDKTHRIERQVDSLTGQLGLSADEIAAAQRAATLCKADLATKMVVEMTSLQGIMGAFYARQSGENDAVAQAIFEHYLPRYAGDAAPRSKAGLLVGIADRLDTLAGLFSAGLAPTGTKDPFAQRRAALGLVQNLMTWNLDFDLRAGLDLAAQCLPVAANPEILDACLDFITGRLRSYLLEQGSRYDVVEAVLAQQGRNPAGVARSIPELTAWTNRSDWAQILPAYARCVRITRDQKEKFNVVEDAMVDPAEKALWTALAAAEKMPRRVGSVDDFLNAFLPLIPAINTFFDTVMVMVDDPRVRSNRLGLLQRIAALASGAADLSKLEGF